MSCRSRRRGTIASTAEIAPDALGPWELRIQAWVDPYASWLDEHDRKLAAGQPDLSGELSEGRLLFGEGDVEEWHAAAERLSDRNRTDLVTSPALGVDVERERARFGAWYELFPRSWGGFRGVAAVLPEIAALGFDVVYLPPVHPIGETYRKGRNNTEGARKGDPGSPWAIGGAAGGHDALHPDLGSEDDFDGDGGGGALRGDRDRARLRDPVLARPPVAAGAPRVVQPPPRRDDQVRREPAEALPGHPQRRLGLGRSASELWQALLDVVLGWCERGVLAFRVDNPHTKPMPFWEWLIAEVRVAIPRRSSSRRHSRARRR